MHTQSVIRIDHIAERMSTVALLIQCAQNDLQVGRLRSVKARLQRIDECLTQAKETVNEELAMPTAEECSGGQLSTNPLQFKYPVIKDSLTTQILTNA